MNAQETCHFTREQYSGTGYVMNGVRKSIRGRGIKQEYHDLPANRSLFLPSALRSQRTASACSHLEAISALDRSASSLKSAVQYFLEKLQKISGIRQRVCGQFSH
jgi:hypothetical protein